MTDKTFTRFVIFPAGKEVMAQNLGVCFISIGEELTKLRQTKVKGIRIDQTERKLIVTLAGEDPQEGKELQLRRR